MSLIDDIRTIAKTKELEEKLAKLAERGDADPKTPIEGSRRITYQDGDTTTNSTLGPPPGYQGPTSAGGGIIDLHSKNQPSGSSTQAPGQASGGSSRGSSNNDLSNNADEAINGGDALRNGGGPNGADAGLQATLDQIKAQLIAAGATADEQRRAIRQYQVDNGMRANGVEDVGQLYDNFTNVNSSDGGPGSPRIRSITGKDITNAELWFAAHIGEPSDLDYKPSTWVNANTPPQDPTYIEGGWFAGEDSIGTTLRADTYQDMIDAQEAGNTLIASGDIFAGAYTWAPDGGGVTEGPPTFAHLTTLPSGSNSNIVYQRVYPRESGGNFNESFSMFRCDMSLPPVDLTPYCPLTPPAAGAWPKTNTAVVFFKDGKWLSNVYDSEVPLKYRSVSSSTLRLLENVSSGTPRTFQITPANNGGFILEDISTPGTRAQLYRYDGTKVADYPIGMKSSLVPGVNYK